MNICIDKIVPIAVSGVTTFCTFGIAGAASGQRGAARTTSALSTLGVCNTGMKGGVALLLTESITLDKLIEKGIDKIFIKSVRTMIGNGEEINTINERIDKFPVSLGLKAQLKELVL